MNSETHTNSTDVLIVYDSVRSDKRAKELCVRLGQYCELNLRIWNLSALRLPALARAAAHEAGRAILLIVAVDGDEMLPRHVKTCLHKCARAIHAADGALLAQFHSILKMNEELCPAYRCFETNRASCRRPILFGSGRTARGRTRLLKRRIAGRVTWPVSEATSEPGPKTILNQFLNSSLIKPKNKFPMKNRVILITGALTGRSSS